MPRCLTSRTHLLGIAALALTAFWGCGDNGSSETPDREPIVLEVSAHEYYFLAAETITAGPTTLLFKNEGQEDHEMALVQLDGVSTEEFHGRWHQEGLVSALESTNERAYLEAIGPGETGQMEADLEDGEYVFICQTPTPDGTPHGDKGMTKVLTVTSE